jgi:hypothetical protein
MQYRLGGVLCLQSGLVAAGQDPRTQALFGGGSQICMHTAAVNLSADPDDPESLRQEAG